MVIYSDKLPPLKFHDPLITWSCGFDSLVYDLDLERKGRSSQPIVLRKKGILRNFSKFTGKHLCHNLFFNKVVGLPATW